MENNNIDDKRKILIVGRLSDIGYDFTDIIEGDDAKVILLDHDECNFPSLGDIPILPQPVNLEALYFKVERKNHKRPYKYHK